MRQAVTYCRVSTDLQKEEKTIEIQQIKIKEFAVKNNYEIIGESSKRCSLDTTSRAGTAKPGGSLDSPSRWVDATECRFQDGVHARGSNFAVARPVAIG